MKMAHRSWLFIGFVISLLGMMTSCSTEDVDATQGPGVAPGGLIINEVLYDPSNSGLAGDANNDGIYNQTQDEFIEFVNNGGSALDLSGYTVSDSIKVDSVITVRFTFPANSIIMPGKAFVVFGGGTPTGSFGGANVFLSQDAGGLNMNNSGEAIVVKDATGKTVLVYDTDALSDNPNESYTRNPDIIGLFVQHTTASASRSYSPGTRINGAAF
jgi:Lamin Tail Domain